MNILLQYILDRPAKPLCSRKAELASVSSWGGGYSCHADVQQDSVDSNESGQSCAGLETPNKFVIDVVSQLLEMASDDRELTSIDRQTVADVLRYGSVAKVAELHDLPVSTIYSRLGGAFHRLTRQMDVWQNDRQQIARLSQQLSEQQATARAMMSDLEAQEAEIKELRADNEMLRLQLDKAGDDHHKSKLNLRKLTPQLKRRLACSLEKVAFPRDVVRLLNDHNIFKVSDLIRQSETDLLQLDGLTAYHIEKIKDRLHFMRFQLNTDIIYVEALDDYYLKEKSRKAMDKKQNYRSRG